MKPARKVAFLSNIRIASGHRLELGALSYADAHPQIVLRHFCIPYNTLCRRDPDAPAVQLRTWRPDGLLSLYDSEPMDVLLSTLATVPPIVSLCGAKPRPGMAFVTGNFVAWAQTGIDHLRQQGIRSLAYLSLDVIPGSREVEVFLRIARPASPSQATLVEPVDVPLLENPEAKVAPVPPRLAAWLRSLPKPVGVLCQSAGGGGYLVRVCRALRLRVPEDVAIIGVDEVDLAIASDPPVTTVVPAMQQIGREAMRVLDRMMQGHPAPAEPVRLDAMDLHVRQSTAARRAKICDIAAALDYINQHACRGITVGQLVNDTQCVSRMTFRKHFQEATGQTPLSAIQQRQMEEARRLLRDTKLSVTVIAGNCGFSDSSSFARGFRAAHGLSPVAYRDNQSNRKPGRKRA